MPSLLLKLPKKQKRRNCKLRQMRLTGKDKLRRLKLSHKDNKLLQQQHSKPKRLNLKLKDRDKKLSMMQL